ncbi:MAG: sulfatase [Bryobacterales bacterium]|nr:sulfatase [Acidobacteriota bacterium]MCB9385526.1 sulfatase [Bryobacterales bacterium]
MNVLFVTIDTLRADHLSAWGYHLETSPNLDKLAAEGVRYENAYTVTSRTAPSHLSMFTSRYPQEHGAKLNGFALPQDSKFLLLPQVLQKHGYKNAAFVSAWPLTKKLTKIDPYFDVYDEDLSRSYQTINSMRYAEDVTPRAIDWIKKNKQGPFFAWVHYFDPHSPYDFRPEYEVKKQTGKPDHTKDRGEDVVMKDLQAYNSEILYTDHWVGKLIEALDAEGLKENTLVIVTADHGESIGERGYQGHSHRLYESVVHIPLIFRMPGTVQAGKTVSTRVSTLDLMPTILDMTLKKSDPNAKVPTDMDGRSLAANLEKGEEAPDRTVRYVAFGGQKWLMPGWLAKLWLRDLDFPLKMGYRAGEKKVIWTPEKEELEIFNLTRDPFENKALTPEEGEKAYDGETDQLTKWFKATHLNNGENRMDEKDQEALKSLGYIQ